MSTTVYLREDKLRSSEGFKSIDRRSGDGNPYKEYHLDDEHISYSDGRWELYISDSMEVLPEPLKGLATGFSLYRSFPIRPSRERGIYRYRTATAELELENTTKEAKYYQAKIKGRELPHVQKLLQLIKAGEIRPETSYDGEQSGLTRTGLEAKAERLEDELGRTKKALTNENARLRKRFEGLAEKLRSGWWPFGCKLDVANQIDEILAF